MHITIGPFWPFCVIRQTSPPRAISTNITAPIVLLLIHISLFYSSMSRLSFCSRGEKLERGANGRSSASIILKNPSSARAGTCRYNAQRLPQEYAHGHRRNPSNYSQARSHSRLLFSTFFSVNIFPVFIAFQKKKKTSVSSVTFA